MAYTLSTTKLEIKAKSFLLGIKGLGGERGGGVGGGGRGRNDPSLVCTYE
jgi:hypothetical protein